QAYAAATAPALPPAFCTPPRFQAASNPWGSWREWLTRASKKKPANPSSSMAVISWPRRRGQALVRAGGAAAILDFRGPLSFGALFFAIGALLGGLFSSMTKPSPFATWIPRQGGQLHRLEASALAPLILVQGAHRVRLRERRGTGQ